MAEMLAEHCLTPGLDPAQVLGMAETGHLTVLRARTDTFA